MKPASSSAYLRFLRRLPCANCGARPPSEAAHGPNAGLSRKGSDLDALPLCVGCHREGRHSQHGLGSWEAFAEFWDLDLEELRASYRERWESVKENRR